MLAPLPHLRGWAGKTRVSMIAEDRVDHWWKGSQSPASCPGAVCVSDNVWWHYIPGRLGLGEFSSVAQSCPTLCDSMNHSTPGLPVHHQIPESTQTHVHWVSDAIQPSHPLSSPSPPAPNPSQHQGLFQWVNSLHQVAKVLEFQLQHQSFQWIFRTDFF